MQGGASLLPAYLAKATTRGAATNRQASRWKSVGDRTIRTDGSALR
jgi:hypothetical protein